jgi:hypothetical protein
MLQIVAQHAKRKEPMGRMLMGDVVSPNFCHTNATFATATLCGKTGMDTCHSHGGSDRMSGKLCQCMPGPATCKKTRKIEKKDSFMRVLLCVILLALLGSGTYTLPNSHHPGNDPNNTKKRMLSVIDLFLSSSEAGKCCESL